jgi:hypothetical protein
LAEESLDGCSRVAGEKKFSSFVERLLILVQIIA